MLALVVMLAGLGLVTACGDNDNVSPSKPAVQVVAFGDSLVAGVGTTGGNNFVSLLSQRTGISILNAGRSGDTTATALMRLQTDVLSRSPEVVIVLLGGNDLLQGVPVSQRMANITNIAMQLRATGAKVLLIGLGNDPIDPYAGALPGIATQTGSTHIPGILEGIFGVPSLMSDPIHPNNAGHAIMADRIEPSLRAAVAAMALASSR